MRQSNIPSDLKKGPDLPNNQPKCFSNARQKIRRKRKRKEKFSVRSQFLLMMNKQKVIKTTIKCTCPLEKGQGTFKYRLHLLQQKENKERGVSEQHVLCNLLCLLTYHCFVIMVILQPDQFPKCYYA